MTKISKYMTKQEISDRIQMMHEALTLHRMSLSTDPEARRRLEASIERHARQRFTPVQRLHILANVRATMDTPCDTGLPWLPPLGEAFMEHLIHKDGANVPLTTEEEAWRDAVYAERKYVQDTIRKAFCSPTQTLWEGLSRFGHDLLNMHNRPDLNNAAFRKSVRAAMIDAWGRYQAGQRSGYYYEQERLQKQEADCIARGATT
jgi:hypothetical protein